MARVDALEQRKCRPVTDGAQTPRLFYVSVGQDASLFFEGQEQQTECERD